MVVPYRQLSTEALQGVIEEFVTREGTDYGGTNVPLADKVAEVLGQLERGQAVLVYDEETQSCNIIASDGA